MRAKIAGYGDEGIGSSWRIAGSSQAHDRSSGAFLNPIASIDPDE